MRASFGTRLALRGAPAPGGTSIALVLARGDLRSGPEDTAVGLTTLVAMDNGIQRSSDSGTVTGLQVLSRSVATSAFLPDGQALVFVSELDLPRGTSHDIVVIRRTGGELPARRVLELDDGASLTVANLGVVAPPGAFASSGLLDGSNALTGMPMVWFKDGFDWFLAATVDSGRTVGSCDELLRVEDEATSEEYGPWLLVTAGSSVPEERRPDVAGRFARRFDQLAAPTDMVEVEITLGRDSRGGVSGDLASARIPLRVGHSASIVLGIEGIAHDDHHLEVAQLAVAPAVDPSITFDGLVLWLMARRSPSGGLTLDVRGAGHVESGRRPLDLGLRRAVDSPSHDRLFVAERLWFGPDEAERTVVLGAAEGNGAGDLSLEISVEE
jgi:hypothetical protein